MLEIPESYSISRQLGNEISGKRIVSAAAGHSPHKFAFYSGDPAGYGKLLAGKTIGCVNAVAGFVEIEAGNYRLLFGDGANIRYHRPGDTIPEKHQLLAVFDDGSAITCTIQMYGGIWVFEEGNLDNKYYRIAKEKPNPLTDGFNLEYFMGMANGEKRNLSLKALLATEQRIPGLGNGVLQDILFHAGLNPRTKLSDLGPDGLDMLFSSTRDTIRLMAKKGGRDTEKDIYGREGGYRTVMSAKNLGGQCPRCGGKIVRQAYMGGNVYFCPSCQKI
ncbi:formamidopyrimidine-DNA glycosylase [Youngiibacter fragilis]|uniref:Formamidopyrimidine-DNA glycosylase n=1 Tax=Youngiibacter fragilis 232.1 TaxID=994573 RepID=V7I4T2_9CLOT|nr:formamidopyrimidine-DNA glycosylase [Youngiibacter fragilis]ETA81245.1 formamidopyrimidine-DNA glycosylase [Youngiibacter fragilis 232.1]